MTFAVSNTTLHHKPQQKWDFGCLEGLPGLVVGPYAQFRHITLEESIALSILMRLKMMDVL
jgi:hypothetical protein